MNVVCFRIVLAYWCLSTCLVAIQPEQLTLEAELSKQFFRMRAGKSFLKTGRCPTLLASGEARESLSFKLVHLCDNDSVSTFFDILTIDLMTGRCLFGVDDNKRAFSSPNESSAMLKLIGRHKLTKDEIKSKLNSFILNSYPNQMHRESAMQSSKIMIRVDIVDTHDRVSGTFVIHSVTGQLFHSDMYSVLNGIPSNESEERKYTSP